jgi:hypothetical protein
MSFICVVRGIYAFFPSRQRPPAQRQRRVPGESVSRASDDYRGWARGLLTGPAREAGADEPERLGRQLHMSYDGASLSARMNRDPAASATARAAPSRAGNDPGRAAGAPVARPAGPPGTPAAATKPGPGYPVSGGAPRRPAAGAPTAPGTRR